MTNRTPAGSDIPAPSCPDDEETEEYLYLDREHLDPDRIAAALDRARDEMDFA